MFDFQTKKVNPTTAIVTVQGSLDESNRDYFFGCLQDLIGDGFVNIIVDCDGLGFISSSGLAGLIIARGKAIKNGGKIFLTHVQSTIADVLQVTRLNSLFSIYPSTSELLRNQLSRVH